MDIIWKSKKSDSWRKEKFLKVLKQKWIKDKKEKLGSFLTFWISFIYNKMGNFLKAEFSPNSSIVPFLSFSFLKSNDVVIGVANASFCFKLFSTFSSWLHLPTIILVYYYLLYVLLENTMILGKIKGKRWRGWQRMRWLDGIIDSVDMSLSKLWAWRTWKPGVLQSMGL